MSSQNVLDQEVRVHLYIGSRESSIRMGNRKWSHIETERDQTYSLMGVYNEVGERIDDESELSKRLQNVPREVFEASIPELRAYPGQIHVRVGGR